jgi:uncharacterized protein (DUF1800 family)
MTALPLFQTSAVEIGPRVALHALNRLGYGPRPGDIRRVLDRGLEAWVSDQLEAPADPDLLTRLARLPTLNYPIAQVLAIFSADQRALGPILDEFYTAKIVRAVHGQNQLQEVLTDFWFNHFNVYLNDGFNRYSTMAYERDAIRPHALGRFRDLLGATAQHPAMVYYLDNYLSTVSRVDPRTGVIRRGLNENYGRELLELHTVGVDAGYTQADVFDAARCFTGWTIDNLANSGNFVFRSQNHDREAKHVFGLSVPAGGGKEDGDRLLDYLAQHPSTARFVSRKLLQRFVADSPSEPLIERCAERFRATDGDIREVMRAIVSSPEFWSEAFTGGKPKTPFEFVASALRAADANVTSGRAVAVALASMGMPAYQCLPPTGYSNRGDEWLNPSSHMNRVNFALDLAAGTIAGVSVDLRAMMRGAGGNPEDPRSVAAVMSAQVFARSLTPETFDAAAQVAVGGPVSVVARVVGLCLASPEFQAR